MTARFDAPVWAGVERRLTEVERFIPQAPPWTGSAETAVLPGRVRPGPTLARGAEGPRAAPGRLILAITVVTVLLAIVAAMILAGTSPTIDRLDQPFGPYGVFRGSDPRSSAVVLPDGRVLVVSGDWASMGTEVAPRADLFDSTGRHVWTKPTAIGRVGATVTLLLDGRVLVTGGFGGPYAYGSSALASAEIWDPATEAFAMTGSMLAPRVRHAATILRDGRVLLLGGLGPGGTIVSEFWEPTSGAFRAAAVLDPPLNAGTPTLLPNGDVLVIGGGQAGMWRPATGTFEPVSGFADITGVTSATVLLDGRVLYIGTSSPVPAVYVASAGQQPVRVGSLLEPRSRFATTLLLDGRVLITGGVDANGEYLRSVELWDPVTGNVTPAPPLARAVSGHTALLLTDGRVLIVSDVVGPEGSSQPLVYQPTEEGVE